MIISSRMEAVVALTELESYIGRVVDALKCEQNENKDLAKQVSDLKTEVGRLEALLADKKPESECECCKHRDEALVDAIADAVGVKPDKIRKITVWPFSNPNENTERAPKEDPCCDEESEPTLKDLYDLGRYLVDTVDEIESIHIQVVRTRKKEDEDDAE